MDAILGYLDTPAKRWLALLVVVFLVSAGVLVHSLLDALSPPEKVAEATPKAVTERPEQVEVRSEPTWNAPPPEPDHTATRASPFAAQDAVEARVDPTAAQKRIHKQADYLRDLIAKGQLPKGLGNLTKEQVDEMEKNGIMPD